MRNCPICNNPRNLEITNAILSGDMTISQALKELGIQDRKVIEKHLKDHIRVLSSGDGVVAVEYKELDAIGILTKLITNLDRINDRLVETVELNDEILDVTNLRLLNDTVNRIASTIKVLGEFRGDIQTELKVELQLQTNFTMRMQQFLMENLCEEDKRKFFAWLEQNVD